MPGIIFNLEDITNFRFSVGQRVQHCQRNPSHNSDVYNNLKHQNTTLVFLYCKMNT